MPEKTNDYSSLYIHIPFCEKRCNYCGLSSTEKRVDEIDSYVKSLVLELSERCVGKRFKTLFIGGGTPSLLSPPQMEVIINAVSNVADFSDDCEMSIEVNPESVTEGFAATLSGLKFNRISIGAQSLVEKECAFLGRLHTPKQVKQTFHIFREKGITNLSLDLIGAFPEHNIENWKVTLSEAIALEPTHISFYLYHQEEDTVFDSLLTQGKLLPVTEDKAVEIYEYGCDYLHTAGYRQYEISNFAKKGFKSRHNLNYWYDGEYIGVGAGAVSFIDGERYKNIGDPLKYSKLINKGESPVDFSERLDIDAKWREAVVLRLRMTKYFDLLAINPLPHSKIVADVRSELVECAKLGLVKIDGDRFCLSKEGLLLANEVMSRVV